jgi:hypothetical protein
LKRHFVILSHPPEYAMSVQVRIPPALAAVHNFIRKHDPEEICEFGDVREDPNPGGYGVLGEGPPRRHEISHATSTRNHIAGMMWEHYQRIMGGFGEDSE